MNFEMDYEEMENIQENTSLMDDAGAVTGAVDFQMGSDEKEATKAAVEYAADGSPILCKLTPEQQSWFLDTAERLNNSANEIQDFLQEQEEYEAVHNAPIYDGLGTPEQVYRYDAEKEYEENGDTARYRELLEYAAEARLRRDLGHW